MRRSVGKTYEALRKQKGGRNGNRYCVPESLFPSVLDNAPKFSPEELASNEGNTRKRTVDEDIAAVTNLYSQLVYYCKETLEFTGQEPQIIITDHADNLTLTDGAPFEELVQGVKVAD